MPATLTWLDAPTTLKDCDAFLVLGRQGSLRADGLTTWLPPGLDPSILAAMIGTGDPGDTGRSSSTFLADPVRRLTVGVLPETCSRFNAPSRSLAIPGIVRAAAKKGSLGILVTLEDPAYAFASALAIARALPLFTAASAKRDRAVSVAMVSPSGPVPCARFTQPAQAVRQAGAWVDSPPDRLGVDRLVSTAHDLVATLDNTHIHVLRGEEILRAGLGGLHGVGRAAEQEPALIVLDYAPAGAVEHHAWVGKGIVYDTGGLSLKTKTGMPGMKSDMGGAAAVLAAFVAAVRAGSALKLSAILCVAENAIGPGAFRPDDILTMLSGKTVEVNNTDAEGRLVLADGVAWAVRYRSPDTIIDMATLTGAQSIATGRQLAAIVCNDDGLERTTVLAGRASGDLVHPLPYAPELHRSEFASRVADMRNSVKDRRNAQSSCAGQFIANHLGDFSGTWLHVDMAGPSMSGGRATGYGVGLLLTRAGVGAADE